MASSERGRREARTTQQKPSHVRQTRGRANPSNAPESPVHEEGDQRHCLDRGYNDLQRIEDDEDAGGGGASTAADLSQIGEDETREDPA